METDPIEVCTTEEPEEPTAPDELEAAAIFPAVTLFTPNRQQRRAMQFRRVPAYQIETAGQHAKRLAKRRVAKAARRRNRG